MNCKFNKHDISDTEHNTKFASNELPMHDQDDSKFKLSQFKKSGLMLQDIHRPARPSELYEQL